MTVTAPAATRTVEIAALGAHDRETLAGITGNAGTRQVERKHWDGSGRTLIAQEWIAQAYITYLGRDGRVEHGPCRGSLTNNLGRCYEVSPFPGAWACVTEDQVVAVNRFA